MTFCEFILRTSFWKLHGLAGGLSLLSVTLASDM